MVGIVVVSHSPDLARAAVSLALQMVHGPVPQIEIAAGTSDDRLGTDPVAVAEAVVAADDGEGVVVIMDLGSAVLSAELALELLSRPGIRTRLVPAAFVEGIFAAVISAAGGAQLDAVARDAEEALDAKAAQLGQPRPPTGVDDSITSPASVLAKAIIVNPDGIHARPAALIVEAVASLDARVTVATDRSAPVSARSPTALMSLGTRAGDVLRIEADGADAASAVDRIVALVRDGFSELAGRDGRSPETRGGSRLSPHPIGVSPGRVVGPALRMPDPIAEPDPAIRIPEAERPAAIDRLAMAAAEIAEQLRRRLGILTEEGGATSHTAIIARSLGIPAVVGVRGATAIPDGTLLLVDGTTGEVIKEPAVDQQATAATVSRRRERLISPGSTADGHRIALLANIGSTHDTAVALECGAEGVVCTAPSSASWAEPRRLRSVSRSAPTARCSHASEAVGWWCAHWTPAPTSQCRSSGTRRSPTLPWVYADFARLRRTPRCLIN
jgi:multiphosphoryl transfer protein